MSTHIVFPNESGQLFVAGPNTNGQLSLGTTTQTNTFTLAKIDPSTNISGIIQTSVGSAHTLMLRSTGTACSCGLNTNGQLGLGTTADTSFVEIVLSSASSILGNITAVAAGASHSLFLLSDGSAIACGLNTSNQLGDGTAIQRNYPVNVLKSAGVFLNPVSSIAGGTSHSVFATTDGSAWCCGLNTNNQLGDGTTTTRAFATQVRTGVSTFLSGVSQIAAGESHSLALTTAGTVFGWGRNNSGQLAFGTTVDSAYATQCLFTAATPMTGIISIASHANHSLFLTASGIVFSCGLNTNGQLGDGTTTNRSYPVVVSTSAGVPLTDIVSIGTAANQSYFIRADGRVYACGNGQTGGLGNGSLMDSSFAVLVLSGSETTMKSFGYSAAYWRSQGISASTLVNGGGYGAYDLINGGYNKTDLSNAGFSIASAANSGIRHLYALGYSHNEIVNGTNAAVTKIGQLSVATSKIGSLMSGGLLDAPRSVSVVGHDASSISVAISEPGFSTGLTGYAVSAVPATGGSTVAKSLGLGGTLVDGLATGKIYDLLVRSASASGNSTATVVRNSTSLSVPASLSSTSITNSSITVNFAALPTQDCSYGLRTEPPVARYVLAPGSTSQALTGLTDGTTYNVVLDASNVYTATQINNAALGTVFAQPFAPTITSRTTTSLALSVAGTTKPYTQYNISYRPLGGAIASATDTSSNMTLTGLSNGRIYDVSVNIQNAYGTSEWSPILRNSTALTLSTLSTGTITGSSIDVSFSSALGAQDCSYVLRTVPNVNQYVLAAGATSQVLSGLTGGISYSIILDASNAYVSSNASTNATTPIPPSPYASAIYYFSFNNTLTNEGTNTTQTFTTTSNTFNAIGGKTAKALQITTSTYGYMTDKFNLVGTGLNSGSISFFVYPTFETASAFCTYIYYTNYSVAGQASGSGRIGIQKNTGNSSYVFFFGRTTSGEATGNFYPQGTELALNNWTFVTITWDVNTNNATLYLNANSRLSITTTSWNAFQTTNTANSSRNLSLQENVGSYTITSKMNIYYGKLAYWDKILNTNEMTTIMSEFI